MKLLMSKRLFWFLKPGARIDTSDPAQLDMYIQQVLTRGTEKDVIGLLQSVPPDTFSASFERVAHFLPHEVRTFWEALRADHQ